MSTDRRRFLKLTAAAAAGGALRMSTEPTPLPARPSAERQTAAVHPRALRILILGGTGFIGPHQVRAALERGHEVTLFNRGRTNAQMFPEVEKLRGDRNGDLEALSGRSWDVVIDNSTARPDWVTLSAEQLRESVDRYYYVSSRSAYASYTTVPMTAAEPTFTYETAGVDPGTARDDLPYGLAKAESERAAMEAFPDRTGVFRPGLIIGPGDPTDRFTYWPVRIDHGGEVLAPGDGTDPIQIIDVRDLCEWMIRSAEAGQAGLFNAVGPATPRPVAEMLYGIRAVTTAETSFTWVDTDFLLERDVLPYREMPVWMPARDGREGFARFDLTNEIEHGLTFRSLATTSTDTLEFHFSRPTERRERLRAGISREREAEVLAEWHART